MQREYNKAEVNRMVETKADCGEIQEGLSNMSEWTTKWQM